MSQGNENASDTVSKSDSSTVTVKTIKKVLKPASELITAKYCYTKEVC